MPFFPTPERRRPTFFQNIYHRHSRRGRAFLTFSHTLDPERVLTSGGYRRVQWQRQSFTVRLLGDIHFLHERPVSRVARQILYERVCLDVDGELRYRGAAAMARSETRMSR